MIDGFGLTLFTICTGIFVVGGLYFALSNNGREFLMRIDAPLRFRRVGMAILILALLGEISRMIHLAAIENQIALQLWPSLLFMIDVSLCIAQLSFLEKRGFGSSTR